MKRIGFLSTITSAGAVLLLPSVAAAEVNLNDLRINLITGGDLFGVIGKILNLVLLLAGILAFFYALWGGFQYLTSAGDPGKASAGQKTIVNAIIGIILIAVSYALVVFVTGLTRGQFNAPSGSSSNGSPIGSGSGSDDVFSGGGGSSGGGTSSGGSGGGTSSGDAGTVPTASGISGTVSLPEGEDGSLNNMLVTLKPANGNPEGFRSTRTRSDGSFNFRDLPNGDYQLIVESRRTGRNYWCGQEDTHVSDGQLESLSLTLSQCTL